VSCGGALMGMIEDFLARYRKEYDFYSQAGRLVAQTLESNLQAAGVRCIVTNRAKAIARLDAKCRQRAAAKDYQSVEDIFTDIVDLAGVRVALYFPAERDQVDNLINRLFVQVEPSKEFPERSTPIRAKRFSGYGATHYRVRLREAELSEPDRRYAEARVEIQVASVLMHAWAEVEHDLVYKPTAGELSDDEYAILDELNGLVLTGEIALERLQTAGERRVAARGTRFSNHYDLAAHILSVTTEVLRKEIGDAGLGRIDFLYDFLTRIGFDTPDKLAPYLDALSSDIERRPVAEQIIDRLLAEDESRYPLYEDIRSKGKSVTAGDGFGYLDAHEQVGFFMTRWIAFERLIRSLVPSDSNRAIIPSRRVLEQLELLDPETLQEVERLRRLRNNLVHGIEIPDTQDLDEAGRRIQTIIGKLTNEKPR
jgi:ppGpp synthetase/RelA/SpoT-type nucleotidyltranferase